MKNTNKFLLIIGVLVIVLVGYLIYTSFAPTLPSQEVGFGINPPFGNVSSKIVIVEFSDFQCPACKAGEPVVDRIMKEYNGSIVLYYRNLPLTQIHQYSYQAAEAAEAAKEQGKFWEYHKILFNNSPLLDKDSLIKYAQETGLNITQFTISLNSGKFDSSIDQDISDAKNLGVQGTPTFFINDQIVLGADYNKMKQIIDSELAK